MLGKKQKKNTKGKIRSEREINHKAQAPKFHFNKFIIHANLSNMEAESSRKTQCNGGNIVFEHTFALGELQNDKVRLRLCRF